MFEPRNAGHVDLAVLTELEVVGQPSVEARYCTECTWGLTRMCDRFT
ncbi:hypothetical protein ACQEU3_38945 [Spirillospora sp. CA-253888]